MSTSLRWRVGARLLAVLGLVALLDGGATAHTVPQIQLGTRAAAAVTPQDGPASTERGPFGLTVAHDSALAARWRRLQPVIHIETQVLARCHANRQGCPPTAARFLAIVEAARAQTGRARIGRINRAVNLAIRPLSDEAQFGVPDVWTTPLMTFASGAGDCEDYAIAKFVALRLAGVAARDLRLIILHERLFNEDHAVTAVRLDGRWLILDNRYMALQTDREVRNVTPLLAFESERHTTLPRLATALNSPSKPAAAAGVTIAETPTADLARPLGISIGERIADGANDVMRTERLVDNRLPSHDIDWSTKSLSDIYFPNADKIAFDFHPSLAG